MITEAIKIKQNLSRAERKHPKFPELVCARHTTYRSLVQNRDFYTEMNDKGKETIASVLGEEVSELLCEMFKKRWGRAEKELLDVIAVCFRIWKIIRKEKKSRYNKIVSYRKYKKMLEHRTLVQSEMQFSDSKK